MLEKQAIDNKIQTDFSLPFYQLKQKSKNIK